MFTCCSLVYRKSSVSHQTLVKLNYRDQAFEKQDSQSNECGSPDLTCRCSTALSWRSLFDTEENK